MENSVPVRQWYKRWWGISILVFLAIIGLFIVLLTVTTYRYWREIKNGNGARLAEQVFSGFTPAEGTTATVFGAVSKPNRSDLERSDAPYLGNPRAPIVIVEFLDFKCPNCNTEAPIIRQVIQKYGSKIKFIVRNFPVESTHPGASGFAEIGWCSQQQGRFWPVLDYFFNNQATLPEVLGTSDLAALAGATQIDLKSLETCLNGSSATTAVNRDYVDGAKFGVRGTPTFFINGEKVEGVVPFAVWESFLKDQ